MHIRNCHYYTTEPIVHIHFTMFQVSLYLQTV